MHLYSATISPLVPFLTVTPGLLLLDFALLQTQVRQPRQVVLVHACCTVQPSTGSCCKSYMHATWTCVCGHRCMHDGCPCTTLYGIWHSMSSDASPIFLATLEKFVTALWAWPHYLYKAKLYSISRKTRTASPLLSTCRGSKAAQNVEVALSACTAPGRSKSSVM